MPSFKPRDRKQRHRHQDAKSTSAPTDTNVAEIIPMSKAEKEAKRQRLREELREQQPKMSSKKKKRLDKYIETKLRKDENLEYMKKLAETKIDLSEFRSIKDMSKKERRQNGQTDSSLQSLEAGLSGDESDEFETGLRQKNASAPDIAKPAPSEQVGSGLKRPLELGADGFPILKKRKRTRKLHPVVQEVPWEGFDSGENDDDEDSSNTNIHKSENISRKQMGIHENNSDDSDNDQRVDLLNEDQEKSDSMGSDKNDSTDDDSDGNDDDDDDEEEEEEEDTANIIDKRIRPRNSAFKAWATQRINEAVGFKPSSDQPHLQQMPASSELLVKESKIPKNTIYEEEPLPPELLPTTGDPDRKAFSVSVTRSEEIQEARLKLPVVGEEQKIMEAIYNNPSIVIWGATGSGKTTQLPQFLFEAGYGHPDGPNPGMIAVTQPRRVAAVSMSKRVGDELGQFSDRVSYQIRFDTNVSSNTAIKFMTDGVLLREIAKDFSLSKYSVVIIDEAHERSVNTDILIGMVSRIVDLRESMRKEDSSVRPLKLVIMSATLRISDFTQNKHLFRHGTPPLVQAEGRQYPVTIHFAKRTRRDYVEEAFRKVSRGHRKLPPGAMLVFLTGQNEIKHLSKRLKQTFQPTQRGEIVQGKVQLSAAEASLETEDIELGVTEGTINGDEDSDVDILGLDDDEEEEDEQFNIGEESVSSSTKVHVLPLYSQLPTKEQLKVFEQPPEGSRLIVLATNVAETSLTIPGIKYVFDCGRSKEKQYDLSTGVQTFQIGWISKASASQRAGRAGRTGPGHCYRLYSSAIYEADFEEYSEPEILRSPIEGIVLQMKSMGLHNVINFPFPTPPSRQGLAKAEKLLKYLGALKGDGQVTELGKKLSLYPLSPRYGKMLQIGHQHGCMPYVIALVSALAVGDLFIQANEFDLAAPRQQDQEKDKVYTNADRLEDTQRESRRKDFNRAQRLLSKHDDSSDALKYLSAICAYAYSNGSPEEEESFCEQMFVRSKGLKEASQLRKQLTEIVRANNPGLLGPYEARLPEPTAKQVKALKQIVTAGFIDNVAIRADTLLEPLELPRTPRRAIDVPYYTLFRSREGRAADISEKAVYIHPSSVLAQFTTKEMPQYIVYSHLQQSIASHNPTSNEPPKIRMFPLTAPSGPQLAALANGTPLLEYGKPLGKVESLGGTPERRQCVVVPSLVGEPETTGWPLPAKKVVQIKDPKEGWIVEKIL